MSEQSEIALTIPADSVLAVFTTEKGADPYLAQIRAEIDGFKPDTSTKAGRDKIASIAYKVARSKTYLDGVGKQLVEDYKEIPKKIDAERKRVRDLLDSWKDEVRKPLTDWEAAEESRLVKHKTFLEMLTNLGSVGEFATSHTVRTSIASLESAVVDASCEEFEAEAHRAKAASLAKLTDALARIEKIEAEQAELAKLRAEAAAREQAEREARIAKEAEDRAKAQAEAAAQREREEVARREAEAKAAAERRELELKLQAERAEREKVEAQQRAERAAKEAEERIARETEERRQADAAELAKREADKKHKAGINNSAAKALQESAGLTVEQAKAVVVAIASGKVPAVKINY